MPDEYRAYGRKTLDYLEENLFRTVLSSRESVMKVPDEDTINDEVRLVECANPFYEAESAASSI